VSADSRRSSSKFRRNLNRYELTLACCLVIGPVLNQKPWTFLSHLQHKRLFSQLYFQDFSLSFHPSHHVEVVNYYLCQLGIRAARWLCLARDIMWCYVPAQYERGEIHRPEAEVQKRTTKSRTNGDPAQVLLCVQGLIGLLQSAPTPLRSETAREDGVPCRHPEPIVPRPGRARETFASLRRELCRFARPMADVHAETPRNTR